MAADEREIRLLGPAVHQVRDRGVSKAPATVKVLVDRGLKIQRLEEVHMTPEEAIKFAAAVLQTAIYAMERNA